MLIDNIIKDLEDYNGVPLTYGDEGIPIIIKSSHSINDTNLARFFVLEGFKQFDNTKKPTVLLTGPRGSGMTVGMTYIVDKINKCNIFQDEYYPIFVNYPLTIANKDNIYGIRYPVLFDANLENVLIALDMLIDMYSTYTLPKTDKNALFLTDVKAYEQRVSTFKQMLQENKCEIITNTQMPMHLHEDVREQFDIYCICRMNADRTKLYLTMHFGYTNYVAQKIEGIMIIPHIDKVFPKMDTMHITPPMWQRNLLYEHYNHDHPHFQVLAGKELAEKDNFRIKQSIDKIHTSVKEQSILNTFKKKIFNRRQKNDR